MSRNNKNARRNAEAKAVSKQRQTRRATGNRQAPGRATAATHGKKRAWWQLGSYTDFAKGKQRKPRVGAAAVEETATEE